MSPQQTETPRITPYPWERLPQESTLWHGRFVHYLTLGPARSVRAAHQSATDHGQTKGTLSAWTQASQRYNWQIRANLYDDEQHRATLEARGKTSPDKVRLLEELSAMVSFMDINDDCDPAEHFAIVGLACIYRILTRKADASAKPTMKDCNA